MNSNFPSYKESSKSTSELVFTLDGGTIMWTIIKQTCIVDSTMEVEYVAISEAFKEVVWLCKFFSALEVIPGMDRLITLYFHNTTCIMNIKDSRYHKRSKHIDMKYHITRVCGKWRFLPFGRQTC